MKKRVLSMIIIVCMVVTMIAGLFPTGVYAIDEDFDFDPDTSTITGYNGPGGALVIPATIFGDAVLHIGFEAFKEKSLTSVIIPNGVISIGSRSFENNQLASVEIPNSVQTINEAAFFINQLSSVVIPTNVTSIGNAAFMGNELTSITMESAETNIGNGILIMANNYFKEAYQTGGTGTYIGEQTETWQLSDASKVAKAKTAIETAISNLAVSNATTAANILTAAQGATLHGVTVAWDGTDGFNKTDATVDATGIITGTLNLDLSGSTAAISVNKTIEKVSPFTFYSDTGTIIGYDVAIGGTDVEIPATIGGVDVEHIGNNAFQNKSLTSVIIPSSVTSIGLYAFAYNELTSVAIPNSVTSIGNGAFLNNELTSITIPEGVTNIGESAFQDNELTSVTIPNSVTSIGVNAFVNNKLTSITIPSSVTSIGNSALVGNQLTSITMEKAGISIGNRLLTYIGNVENLKNAYLAEGTGGIGTYIGTQTGTWTKEIVLSDAEKVALAKMAIHTAISNLAVSNATTAADILTAAQNATLHEVTVAWDGTNGFNKANATIDAAGSITGTLNLTLNSEDDTVSINKSINQLPSPFTFDIGTKTIINYNEAIGGTDVVIPATIGGVAVEHIREYAFHYKVLTSVNIPNSVQTIGESAFMNNQLASVNIPNSVTSISANAFQSNQLTLITIPSSVTSIGNYAFVENQLVSVTIPNGVSSIGEGAFHSNQLTSVIIPDSVTSIGDFAFYDNQLTSITMLRANTSIGDFMLTTYENAESFKNAYLAGGIGTYIGTQDGPWTKVPSDADKVAKAKTAIVNALNNLAVSNTTTADNVLAAAQAATIHGVTVAWNDVTGFSKTDATKFGTGSITGTLNLTLSDEIQQISVSKTIEQLPSSGGSSGGGSSGGGSSKPAETGAPVIVNGKTENAGTQTTTKEEGRTVITVKIDESKIEEKLSKEGQGATIVIPVTAKSDVASGELNGQTIKYMEKKEAVLEIKTATATYTLPASQINIDEVSDKIGEKVALKDIKVNIQIATPTAENAKVVEDTAKKNEYTIVVKPVDFRITCTNGRKTVNVSKFNGYVERTVEIPAGIDPSKITTGIVLNNDGTFSHVPTTIVMIDGKHYAKINSLTNSTYSVIYNPITFKDVEEHWAKDSINDMGSRLIIAGRDKETFDPQAEITRAEFASIVVKGLGLMRAGTGVDSYKDVSKSDWYYDTVSIASEYGIIKGYEDETFGANNKITREEAMVMMMRAMKIANVDTTVTNEDEILSKFEDNKDIKDWAKESVAACVKQELANGSFGKLWVDNNITRAETATIVERMLQNAGLINK